MENLSKAFAIFAKYGNPKLPLCCERGALYISPSINPDTVTPEDLETLRELGFHVTTESGELTFVYYC